MTPRLLADAAIYLGDSLTDEYCPTGLSNAGESQLRALFARALSEGFGFELTYADGTTGQL